MQAAMQFNDNAAALPGRINSINNTLEHEAEGRPIGKRNTSAQWLNRYQY